MSGTLIAGLVLSAIGLWMVIAAFRRRARRIALLSNCARAAGVVIRVEETTEEGDRVDTFAAVVEYKAKDGQTYETKLLPAQRDALPRIGSKVHIFYERSNPKNCDTAWRMWDVNLFVSFSVLVLLIGAGFLFTAWQDAVEPAAPSASRK